MKSCAFAVRAAASISSMLASGRPYLCTAGVGRCTQHIAPVFTKFDAFCCVASRLQAPGCKRQVQKQACKGALGARVQAQSAQGAKEKKSLRLPLAACIKERTEVSTNRTPTKSLKPTPRLEPKSLAPDASVKVRAALPDIRPGARCSNAGQH
eukprot:700541-Pelagomonas_calceolata.AAC.3